ncbi:MAG: hypothetical protein BroJett030_30100 [Alphaproteobacteria bacterium]|nr:MAG: hypothetical protein BroJett030_30100 [Alphaproteobacteria bacterium]
MTMIDDMKSGAGGAVTALYLGALRQADRIPLSLVQLLARVAVARVFWQSAQTKLASPLVTEQLFAYEYRLPLIDPGLAAWLATATELVGAALVFLGLFSRAGALMLLGVAAVIQVFVFPQNWPDHALWAALLLLIVARGAGAVSLDHLAARLLTRS